jgi:PqqD family protein of HPr-rel-A system
MSQGWLRAEGVLLHPVGEIWVAYSPASAETHLINESGAALIQALDERSPRSRHEVVQSMASDAGLSEAEVEQLLANAWEEYLAAGLLRRSGTGVNPERAP